MKKLSALGVLFALILFTSPSNAQIEDETSPENKFNDTITSTDRDPIPSVQITPVTPIKTAPLNKSEEKIYDLVNKYRIWKKLRPLIIDPTLSAIAKTQSDEMANTSKIGHKGFKERTFAVKKEIIYHKMGENVGYSVGYTQPEMIAVEDWILSPGHRRNMLDNYDLTGIASTTNAKGETYFTQIFVRKAWYVKDGDTEQVKKAEPETRVKAGTD